MGVKTQTCTGNDLQHKVIASTVVERYTEIQRLRALEGKKKTENKMGWQSRIQSGSDGKERRQRGKASRTVRERLCSGGDRIPLQLHGFSACVWAVWLQCVLSFTWTPDWPGLSILSWQRYSGWTRYLLQRLTDACSCAVMHSHIEPHAETIGDNNESRGRLENGRKQQKERDDENQDKLMDTWIHVQTKPSKSHQTP